MSFVYENKHILVEKKETFVALVTLNSPPMNLNSVPSLLELSAAFDTLEKDPEARVIVLTGAGQRAFNAGSDLTGFKDMAGDFKGKKFKMELDLMHTVEYIGKPTICAVEGYCLGGGLELACCCDIRIASENALFGQPEINLGLYPASGGLFRLPRIIGYPQALEMMYLGEPIEAMEAHRLGLANKVVPAGTAVEAALAMGAKIARQAPDALRVIKEGSRRMRHKEAKDNYYTCLEYIDAVFDGYNGVEGVEAFLQKRPPAFRYVGKH